MYILMYNKLAGEAKAQKAENPKKQSAVYVIFY